MAGSSPVLILDGGMSRELIRLNAPFRQPEWSALALMEAPHLVEQVHRDFAAAGADIITTNSYALVPFHIGADRFREQAEDLAALSGRLARNAADYTNATNGRKVLVAGSLPPIFGSYEPALFDAATVQDYLSVLIRALNPYVDFWLGETLSLIAEGEAVRTAIKDTGKPFWISFTLDDHNQDQSAEDEKAVSRLRSGETVAEATSWALKSGAESLLFNCSRPECMTKAIRDTKIVLAQQSRSIPIGIYANAFEPQTGTEAANVDVADVRHDLNIDTYTDFAREWVKEGASIVGGCCGIGCDHIERIANVFNKHKATSMAFGESG